MEEKATAGNLVGKKAGFRMSLPYSLRKWSISPLELNVKKQWLSKILRFLTRKLVVTIYKMITKEQPGSCTR